VLPLYYGAILRLCTPEPQQAWLSVLQVYRALFGFRT